LHWQQLKSLKSIRFKFKFLLLAVLVLSFASGLVLAQHLFPRVTRLPLAPDSQVTTNGQLDNGDDMVPGLLLAAINASGARLDSAFLEAWACLKPSFVEGEAVQELARQVAAALGVDTTTGLINLDDENFHAVFWDGEMEPGVGLYFSVQSLLGTGEAGETYLLVNLEGSPQNGEAQILSWREKIRTAFLPWQVQPHLTYSLIGVIPGQLTPGERKQRAHAVLAALQAEEVEGVEDTEFLSISAYSSRLPGSLSVAGRPVNANVALRYHDTDGNTYIHLGSPLLGGEY